MTDVPLTTEKIWEQFSDKLKYFMLQRVSDEQVAEDLLQETFVRIHRKLDDIADSERLSSWVFQIARNLIIDHYRVSARQHDASTDFIEAGTDNDERNVNEMVMGWLPNMIAQLPDPYRDAVELYELQGIPRQEIADRLGISLSDAKSRVQRVREKLKPRLFDCCSFEMDRRGNIIGYQRNHPGECLNGDGNCDGSQPEEPIQ